MGEDEEINRDVTAQRIKEQLDLIEGDKMQLENLKKQVLCFCIFVFFLF